MIQFDLRISFVHGLKLNQHQTNNTVDASEIWENLRLVAVILTPHYFEENFDRYLGGP